MIRSLLTVALLASLTSPAFAQTTGSTTGALNGLVSDNTKAVLPGVTVSIASPSMMGTREDVTDTSGQYRFAQVPPGVYKLTFTLPGFATLVHENIRVTLGFTATVNTEMQVATQEETITVSGASPVVDVTVSKLTTTYEAAQMANLPSARDYASLMAATPAVKANNTDVGGSMSLSENSYKSYGVSNGQDFPLVEGMLGSEGTSLLFYVDYGSFAEASIGTAANNAEMPGSGNYTRLISKSGGNTYHGGVYLDYYGRNWSTTNIDAAQLALGVTGGPTLAAVDTNRVSTYRDINLDLGGYVVKDKVWWYGSFRNTINNVGKSNIPFVQLTQVRNFTAKSTYNLSTNNKLIAFVNKNSKRQPDRISASNIYLDHTSTWNQIGFPVGVWKVEWNDVLSNKLFLEVYGGKYFYDWMNRSNSDLQRTSDVATGVVTGGQLFFDNIRSRPQLVSSLSYFKDNWFGTHNFKFGGHVMDETFEDSEGAYPGNGTIAIYNNGAPSQIQVFNQPNDSVSRLRTYSVYAQDTWRVTKRLTLSPGVRFDRYRNYRPEQVHVNTAFDVPTGQTVFPAVSDVFHTNNWGPRLGGIYDLTGDGKTVIKANMGIYRDSPGPAPTLSNPNPSTWSNTYTWNDPNVDKVFQVGEQTQLVATSGGLTNQGLDPNLRVGHMNEFTVFGERELVPYVSVRTGVVLRTLVDPMATANPYRPLSAYNVPVPVTIPAANGTGSIGTITAYNLDPALLTSQLYSLRTNLTGFPNTYKTWEITGTKRMVNNWSLVASFANTWSKVYAGSLANPNVALNASAANDGEEYFTNWQGKLSGTFQLPSEIRVSPAFRFQSGEPFARTFTARLNYGNQAIFAEPFGAERYPNVYLVDLRSEKGIRFRGHRASGFFDIFNILNVNPATTQILTSGSTFLRPTVIVSPRVARVGVKIDW